MASQEIAGKYVRGKKKLSDVAENKASTVSLPGPGAKSPTFRDSGLADRIAGDTTGFYRNYRFKDAEKHFPYQPLKRTIDKVYPKAKGGMLLVDEPESQAEYQICIEKAKVLKELGYRYLILQSDTDEYEARLLLGEA